MNRAFYFFVVTYILLWQSALTAQTTYSVLSTAYNQSSGSFYSLGSVDSYWFLTQTQNLVVPPDPASVVNYPNNPTYVVPNSGNNTFTGIVSDHSINYNNSTTSMGQKVVTYRTYFTLPDLSTANSSYSLNFKMSADDAVDNVKLNGTVKGRYLDSAYNNIPGVNKPYMLSIAACDTSFRSGQNFIDVTIADAGGSIGFYGEIILSEANSACTNVTGIQSQNMDRHFFSVSPNPAGSSLSLKCGTENKFSEGAVLKIYSVDGRLMKTEAISSGQEQAVIRIADLAAGIYYLNISSGSYFQSLKFVKE